MTHARPQPESNATGVVPYAPGYSPATVDHYRSRTVARHAAFLLPYMKAGMTLLDCGCGPGTLTIGLARTIAPGMVVGIDWEPGGVGFLG